MNKRANETKRTRARHHSQKKNDDTTPVAVQGTLGI